MADNRASESPVEGDKKFNDVEVGLQHAITKSTSTGAGAERNYKFTPEEVAAYRLDPKVSAAVCRKYDKRILPMVWLMYAFSALDRSNLGNAKTDGLNEDLGLVGNQYNAILSTQSATFTAFTLIGSFLVRYYGPKRAMPCMMLGWGAMAMINAATLSFGSCLAVRFFLGAFEGLFGPTIVIYMSCFYKRSEMGKRVAIYYTSSSLSGAFSGLLAYAVFHIKSHVLKGWQILFLIEGGLTVVVAIIAFFVLPGYPQTVSFLTEEEKKVAVMRLLKEASHEVNSDFDRKEYFSPMKTWRFYALAVFAITYGTAQSTAQTFLPQIIGRFGFSVVKTNLYTVAPYIVGTVWMLINAYLSDYFRQRAIVLAGALAVTMVGCIILAATPLTAIAPGYFACFLIEMGAFIPTAIFHSWHNNNDASENSRAFRTGAMTFFANSGSIVSSQIFLDSDAPKYLHALIASTCLQVLGIAVCLGLRTNMALFNRKRNKEQGVEWSSKDVSTADAKNQDSPNFRFFL